MRRTTALAGLLLLTATLLGGCYVVPGPPPSPSGLKANGELLCARGSRQRADRKHKAYRAQHHGDFVAVSATIGLSS